MTRHLLGCPWRRPSYRRAGLRGLAGGDQGQHWRGLWQKFMYNEAIPWLGQVAWLIQQGEPVARKDLVDLKLI